MAQDGLEYPELQSVFTPKWELKKGNVSIT